MTRALLTLALLLAALPVAAPELSMPALTLTTQEDGSQSWSLSFQVLVAMTLITLMPALLLSMTGFVRIIVVLGLLRQALGTGQTPSNPILLGLALMLTAFIMQPTANAVWEQAAVPYTEEEMDFGEAFAADEAAFRSRLIAEVAQAADVSSTRVQIEYVRAGSLTVGFAFLEIESEMHTPERMECDFVI